ncbi:MAG: MBL fold metallo-hydrolase [Acetivibrionales bacterium]|jgi:L-ascorbate 6-phosphate lactonase
MNYVSRIKELNVEQNTIAISWLGQAGFLIKTSSGRIIAIDPYFSDCVMKYIPEEGLGFKRLTPPLCEAGDIVFDSLLISHEHLDHFDVDSIKAMMSNDRTHVYTNTPVADKMREMGMDMSRVHVLKKGMAESLPDCKVLATDCDHGELAPDALGFILDFGWTKVYYSGDTALNPERLKVPIEHKPRVAILPINGEYGNLNGIQAAEYAGLLGAEICIPCHFWTFALHKGDPQSIIDSIGDKAPECELALMCQGEVLIHS